MTNITKDYLFTLNYYVMVGYEFKYSKKFKNNIITLYNRVCGPFTTDDVDVCLKHLCTINGLSYVIHYDKKRVHIGKLMIDTNDSQTFQSYKEEITSCINAAFGFKTKDSIIIEDAFQSLPYDENLNK